MVKKVLSMTILIFAGFMVVMIAIGVLFLYLSPEFGQTPTEDQKQVYARSENHNGKKFVNQGEIDMAMSLGKLTKMIRAFINQVPNTTPNGDIPVEKIDSLEVVDYEHTKPRLIWFGHSAFLLQIAGQHILLDPMFGKVPAPHPRLGPKRFSSQLPIEVEKLPVIDAVIYSHDHYDHLDYGSVRKLKEKVKKFYTPLGVGNHLKSWGVDPQNIEELNWWEEVQHQDLKFICTPAQHFSGRGFSDRASTLWSSWIIQSDSSNIYFSGDSGYGDHFKEIGEKYGPFDFAMMECGQYNELWIEIHMMPEETAQAALDLNTKLMMPIHWGAFKLAMHTWTDPVERVSKKAEELGIAMTTPQIGEPIIVGDSTRTASVEWWNSY